MATLLSSVTEDTTGTGASHSGPATVFVRGVFDGASVSVLVSDDDTNYVKPDNLAGRSHLTVPGAVSITAYGTYYIRCDVVGTGSSTSVSAVSTQ